MNKPKLGTVTLAWLIFALLIGLLVFVPKLRAQDLNVAICNEDTGVCTLSVEWMNKIGAALEYWYAQAGYWKKQAESCRGT